MLASPLRCPHCESQHLVGNGHAKNGKLRFQCRDCKKYGRQDPGSAAYDPATKAVILAAYHERTSIRGLRRIFGVSRNTVAAWLKKASGLPLLTATLSAAQAGDLLELDELWSFVFRRTNKRWVWLAQCRRTRQIVAYVIGSRGEAACRVLWARIPQGYKTGLLYTDFWAAYAEVLPQQQHRATGKGDGQTCHVERFNNILRQRLARFVRRTLSFSKNDVMHDNCLQLFLHGYNQPTRHQPKRLRLI